MAKHTIVHSCGHAAVVDLLGTTAERDRKAEWINTEGICPDCLKAAQAKKMAALSDAFEVAALKGSPKQITWAEKIRADLLKKIERDLITFATDATSHPSIRAWLGSQADAKWWIDNRDAKHWDLIKQARQALTIGRLRAAHGSSRPRS